MRLLPCAQAVLFAVGDTIGLAGLGQAAETGVQRVFQLASQMDTAVTEHDRAETDIHSDQGILDITGNLIRGAGYREVNNEPVLAKGPVSVKLKCLGRAGPFPDRENLTHGDRFECELFPRVR